MLDFLLVLGQVPGTDFQITFNEIVATFCVLYLWHVYLKYGVEIERWLKSMVYRAGVNYRKRKRMIKSFIRLRRYQLFIFERRLKRKVISYLRHRRHAIFMIFYRRYSALKRHYYIKLVQIDRLVRRAKRSRAFQNYLLIKNFVNQSV